MHPLIREVQKASLQKIPEIRPGYTVRIQQKIKEIIKSGEEDEGGAKIASKKKKADEVRERVQVFEGLVIKVGSGEGAEKTFTVRKIVEGVGVEKVFLMHSPNLMKIEVKKKGDVRRAKLYYMRSRSGKSARLTEEMVSDKDRAEDSTKMEELLREAVIADEKRKAAEAAIAAAKAPAEADAGAPPTV
jgi:large subunit ribosomal protein L19